MEKKKKNLCVQERGPLYVCMRIFDSRFDKSCSYARRNAYGHELATITVPLCSKQVSCILIKTVQFVKFLV